MRGRARVGVLVAALVASVVVTASPSSGEVRPIALTGFRDMLVDEPHGHVFISQGTDEVVVTDLDGNVVTRIPGLYGADGLALSDDGSELYVAMSSGDAIGVVDTATLGASTVATGVATCPKEIAVTAGIVWFTQSCGAAGIGAFDPADDSVTLGVSPIDTKMLAASPGLPGTLFIETYHRIHKLSATHGDTPALTQTAERDLGNGFSQMALSPDGTKIFVVGGDTGLAAYRTTDLAGAGTYRPDAFPNSVAIRADGMVVAGSDGWYDPDLYVYPAGSTTVMRKYEFGSTDDNLHPDGLAFASTRLYAVEWDAYDENNWRLVIITPRRLAELTLKTDLKKVYEYGQEAVVTATLTGGSTNRQVSIYAHEPDRSPVLVAQGNVSADGALTARVKLTRKTSFSASYSGDAGYDAVSAETGWVAVTGRLTVKMQKYRSKSGVYHVYPVHSRAWIQGTLAPKVTKPRCVIFRVQFKTRGSWSHGGRTRCLKLTAASTARAYVAGDEVLVGIPIRFRAEWQGDKLNSSTTSRWLYAKFTR